jgi:hypothetical protein
MESAVLEFDQTVNLTTLRAVEISAEIIQTIDGKVNILLSSMTIVREYQQAMMQQQQDSSGKTDKKLDMIINMQAQLMNNRSPEKVQDKERAQQGTSQSKTDPADRKRHTLNEVKQYFSQHPGWATVIKETKTQRAEIHNEKEPEKSLRKDTDGTGTWLLDEPQFQSWKTGATNPILWIRGSAGVGKTFLAETVITNLEQSLKDRHSSSYFFFHEEQGVLTSWDNAVFALSAQIAEKDSNYCERMAIEVAKDEEETGRWSRCFSTKFSQKEDGAHAYLILDGIDEMKPPDRVKMCKNLDEVTKDGLNIHVLLLSRPNTPEVEALQTSIIDLTKEKLSRDIQKVIVIGCRTLPRLKKFRRPAKAAIFKKIRARADGTPYLSLRYCSQSD